MKIKGFFICCIAVALAQTGVRGQSFFDFDFPGFGMREGTSERQKSLEFDYDVDFSYCFDLRRFDASSQIFMSNEVLDVARLSPSAGLRINQAGGVTHRLMAGVDITKDLGANPVAVTTYSSDEDAETLRNARLFQDIFYYYNLQAALGRGTFDFYAGIFPRTVMQGEYSRAFFSEATKLYDPNLEGAFVRYRTPKLYAEAGWDKLGYKEIDRKERYMVFSAGAYSPLKWLSAGWAVSYMHIGSSWLGSCNVDHAMANPYLKFDFGGLLGLDELSFKAGALASYQADNLIDESPHFPLGAEGILTVRHWNAGIENTLFYGDNMMPFKSSTYTSTYETSEYNSLLYLGEPFYYTHRGYPSFYDRFEVFYEPRIAPFLKARISAVAHFINPTASFDAFTGWQARATLVFDLDALRHPKTVTAPGKGKTSTQKKRPAGPSVKL